MIWEVWEVWKQRIESSLNNRDVSPPPPPSMPPELAKVHFPVNQLTRNCWTTFFLGAKRFGIDFWKLLGSQRFHSFVALSAALAGSASLSGKIWGNPIKSRAPPVSNTGGIKMSKARYRHPHRIMLSHIISINELENLRMVPLYLNSTRQIPEKKKTFGINICNEN